MVVEEYYCNHRGQSVGASGCIKSEVVTNGSAHEVPKDVAEGSSGESLRTYKRRKHGMLSTEHKMQEDSKASREVVNELGDQTRQELSSMNTENHPCEQISYRTTNCCATPNGSRDCSPRYWRNVVLENMCKSLRESKGGIQGCIQDALEYQNTNCTTTRKVPFLSAQENIKKNGQNGFSQTNLMPNGSLSGNAGHIGVASSEPLSKMNRQTGTELCQHAFFNFLVSEKFAALCKLLNENFDGIKVESLFDYSLIDKRMKDGAYECSPKLFTSDMLQVLRKLQNIGAEMMSLAKGLADVSNTSNCEQFCPWGCDSHSKLDQPKAHATSCVRCGHKADGREFLVCDSCEELYHLSCIEPTVTSIPSKTWSCSKCCSSGIELPHEHCVVCERLNTLRTPTDRDGYQVSLTNEDEMLVELEESSNCVTGDGFETLEQVEDTRLCKICSVELKKDEKFRICGHPFCSSKYYHARCLTNKQLKSHASCWYCPSCLCRVCLKDKDDDKIVLCDGCDHGYHTYCMKPPRDSIPRGKWFCKKCNARIQAIRKAKRAYGTLSKKSNGDVKKENEAHENLEKKPKEDCEQVVEKTEGVDMLLTAANTLNIEEKLAACQSN